MFRIPDQAGGVNGSFTDDTMVTQEWLRTFQDELIRVVEDSDDHPNELDNNQLLKSLYYRYKIGSRKIFKTRVGSNQLLELGEKFDRSFLIAVSFFSTSRIGSEELFTNQHFASYSHFLNSWKLMSWTKCLDFMKPISQDPPTLNRYPHILEIKPDGSLLYSIKNQTSINEESTITLSRISYLRKKNKP